MTGRAEENFVARGGAAMGVGGGIGRVVVRPEVGFDFDDAAGKEPASSVQWTRSLPEQARSHQLRRGLEEGA